MLAMGILAVTMPATAQEGEWLPVKQVGDTTYSIHTSDYTITENTIKNATGQVWLKVEDSKNITVIRAKSDCGEQVITIEDRYTNGEQVGGRGQKPVASGTMAETINCVICIDLNFGD